MRLLVTILVCFSVFKNYAGQELCSFRKTTNLCSCGYKLNGIGSIFTADCSRLNIKDHPQDNQLFNVEELDLSYNSIETLQSEPNLFKSEQLITLKLSNNLITHISPDVFLGVPNLKKLKLNNNKIERFVNSNIFRGLGNLTTLDLSHNSLPTLPDDIFSPLSNLKELDLSYNFFGSLLSSSNDFFDLPIRIPLHISHLRLDGLQISELHYMYFERAQNLKRLSLADNMFQLIPTVPYTLDYFDMSRNPIVQISAGHLNYHSLKILKLNKLTKLKTIGHYAFYNLQAMEELHLSNCNLQNFSDLAFGVIDKDLDLQLKRIFLSGNGLTSLNSSYLRLLNKMEHVDLQNNPWNCDCNILWVKQLEGLLHKDYNMRCWSPFKLKNKLVMEITETDVPDCSESRRMTQKILITVLALIIVLLTGLIIYLFYLGPFHDSNKYRGIGPQSPYQPNSVGIQPARAENLF